MRFSPTSSVPEVLPLANSDRLSPALREKKTHVNTSSRVGCDSSSHHRHKSGRESSLKDPMPRSVRRVRVRERGGVVDGTGKNGCGNGKVVCQSQVELAWRIE